MLSAEPIDDTLARRERMRPFYPALNFSTPDQIADIDASAPDRLPTNFTQDMVKFSNYAFDDLNGAPRQSWLSRTTPETEQGPIGPYGPIAPPVPTQRPIFDEGAYDQPFRPGGESDPYGQMSQPGGYGRALAAPFQAAVSGYQALPDEVRGGIEQALSPEAMLNSSSVPFQDENDPYGTRIARNLDEVPVIGGTLRKAFQFASPAGGGNAGRLALEAAAGSELAKAGVGALGGDANAQSLAELAGSVVGPMALPALERGAVRAAGAVNDALAARTAAPEIGRGVREDAFFPRQAVAGGSEDIVPDVAAPRAVALTPMDRLKQAIIEAKPLQQQNDELLRQFRGRQAGGYAGAAGAGEGGFNKGLAAMRGSADRVSFAPLRDVLDQPAIDTLYDRVIQSGLRPFEQANAGSALRQLLDGQVPVPSELAKLEEVMPGLTESLRSAKIVSGPSIADELAAFAAVPQSLMSSLDLSGFRQTATAAYGHPKMAAGAFKDSLKAARSEANFRAIQDDLNGRWYAPMRREAGVVLSDGEQSLTKAEGTLASKIVNKLVPGYRASQRAYATMLNEMRDGLFQRMLNEYGGAADKVPPDELARWGKMINITTGRGVLPAGIAQSNIGGSPLFWAPRLLASRVEMPFELLSSSPQVRKEVARQLVSFVGVNSAILGLGKEAGLWDVNIDPKSADFGQARIGNTRIDPWAGFRPIANLVARLATGERTSTTTGDTTDADRLDIVSDFLRQKFSPLTGAAVNLWTGEDQIGKPYGAKDLPGDILVPLFLQNLIEAVGRSGPEALPLAALGGLGLGVNTYEPSATQVGYKNLDAQKQFDGMGEETWRRIGVSKDYAEAIKGYGSFGAWKQDKIKQFTDRLMEERGLPRGAAEYEAEQAVNRHKVTQAYQDTRDMLEDRWVSEHPEEAQVIWDREMQKRDPRERKWTPTAHQRELLARARSR